MRRDDIILIYIHRIGSALCNGDLSPIGDADLSAATGIELGLAGRLSAEALLVAVSDMSSERCFLVGLGLAHKATLRNCQDLAEKAATILMAAAEANDCLEGPWLVAILQNLFAMRRVAS
jgi:hypothetical protein